MAERQQQLLLILLSANEREGFSFFGAEPVGRALRGQRCSGGRPRLTPYLGPLVFGAD